MTDNQDKELFNTLAALVTGVNIIQSDVKNIKITLDEHSVILNEHSEILNKHSQIFSRLDAKTDSIAETVMTNDRRLTVVEKDVVDLRERIH